MRLPHLRAWFRTRSAIVLHLSNGTIQVWSAFSVLHPLVECLSIPLSLYPLVECLSIPLSAFTDQLLPGPH